MDAEPETDEAMRTRIGISATLIILAFMMTACDRGDYFGPLERTARSVFNGWDMWANESVRPFEQPVVHPVAGTVPLIGQAPDLDSAKSIAAALPEFEQKRRGELAYRRFCYHCHGLNGDGRIIVGESFSPAIPDLRSAMVQSRTDLEMYGFLMNGSPRMISLSDTVPPEDAVLVIEYIRGLKDRPSEPYYAPRNSVPLSNPVH